MNCTTEPLSTIVRDVIMSIAAIATAIAAIVGVNWGLRIWRKQLREKVEFDLARRILRSLNHFRTLVEHARSSLISGNEYPKNDESLLSEGEDPEILNERGVRNRREMLYVFRHRTRRARKESNNLWALIEEAEAFWGHEIRVRLRALIIHWNKLVATIERHYLNDPGYQNGEPMKAFSIIYASGDAEDTYQNELVEKLEAIAEIVRDKVSSLRDSGS